MSISYVSTLFNVTELLENAGYNATLALSYLRDEGVTEPTTLHAVTDIAESLLSSVRDINFFSFYGWVKVLTIVSCIENLNNILNGLAFYFLPSDFPLHCLIFGISTNTDLISSIFTGNHPGIKEIGYDYVADIGSVFNITQISRSGSRIGYLGDHHPYSLKEDCLSDRGFVKTQPFVLYNDQHNRDSKNIPPTYGIEAVHADGYHMVCLEYNSNVSPHVMVEGLLATEPGASSVKGASTLVCSSYHPEHDVSGAFLEKSKKPGHLSIPMLKKKKLAKKIGLKVSSVDADDAEVEELDQDSVDLWKQFQDNYDAISEAEDNELEAAVGVNGTDVSSQSWFNFRRSAKVLGSSSIYKSEDGTMRTKFVTNYVNAYGPPVAVLLH